MDANGVLRSISAIIAGVLVNALTFAFFSIANEVAVSSWYGISIKHAETRILNSTGLLIIVTTLGALSAWLGGRVIAYLSERSAHLSAAVSGLFAAVFGLGIYGSQKPVPYPAWFLVLAFVLNIVFCVIGSYRLRKTRAA